MAVVVLFDGDNNYHDDADQNQRHHNAEKQTFCVARTKLARKSIGSPVDESASVSAGWLTAQLESQ